MGGGGGHTVSDKNLRRGKAGYEATKTCIFPCIGMYPGKFLRGGF